MDGMARPYDFHVKILGGHIDSAGPLGGNSLFTFAHDAICADYIYNTALIGIR